VLGKIGFVGGHVDVGDDTSVLVFDDRDGGQDFGL
jgi:hypothetical protein